ncbi:MAG: hypothetical protein J6X18_00630 [Bacteroidales bacterium]|nr:hypothetical protein [Bacteroidales bacterium]
MITNFTFNDIVLYSKGWYERSENILEDLGYLFSKIYGWTPTTEDEVANFMLITIDELYEKLGIGFTTNGYGKYNNSFASFNYEINNRMRLYKVSYNMAIILWAMSIMMGLDRTQIKLNAPKYGKKERFRLGRAFGGKYPISMTYKEMNKRAKAMFGE